MSLFSKLDYRYIYVLGNTRYPFRYKIGIARNVENRKRGIQNSLRGNIYEIYSVKVFFAQRIEQILHGLYAPFSARMKGSGKTEWFWMILPVTPILWLMTIWVLQWILIPFLLVGVFYIFEHQEAISTSMAALLP